MWTTLYSVLSFVENSDARKTAMILSRERKSL
jgi:hypothetical protein